MAPDKFKLVISAMHNACCFFVLLTNLVILVLRYGPKEYISCNWTIMTTYLWKRIGVILSWSFLQPDLNRDSDAPSFGSQLVDKLQIGCYFRLAVALLSFV